MCDSCSAFHLRHSGALDDQGLVTGWLTREVLHRRQTWALDTELHRGQVRANVGYESGRWANLATTEPGSRW